MATGTDIASMLRQKQLMDQLHQITSQGTEAAMMQPGIQQFQDNTPVNQIPGLTTHRTSPGVLASAALGAAAGGGNVGEAVGHAAANTGIGKVMGLGQQKPAQPQVAQAAPINGVQQQAPPPQQPMLVRRGDTAATGGSTGFQLQLGPDGNVTAIPYTPIRQ